MAFDLNDLAGEALDYLTRTGIAQSHDSEDIAFVVARAPAYLEELEARIDLSIPDTDDIEGKYYLALGMGLGNQLAFHFGGAMNGAVRDDVEDRLKTMMRRGGVSDNKLTPDIALTAPRGLSLARWQRGG